MMSNVRLRNGLVAASAVAALTGATLVAPVAADASARITCKASATPKSPKRYSYVHIAVHTKAKAKVRTVAHYKSTNTAHSTHANSKGNASVAFYISGATRGRKVPVSVTVTGPHNTATCSTSFTPR